jgi:hypothetical protein
METKELVLVGGSAFWHPNGFWIAEMMEPGGGNFTLSATGKTKDEAEANAKLIAAAPDLLEALSYAYQALEAKWKPKDNLGMHFGNYHGFIKKRDEVFQILNRAIKKATE